MQTELLSWQGKWDKTPSLHDAQLVIYFGGKGILDSGSRYEELKGFYPKAIAGRENPALFQVIDRESPHAIKTAKAFRAPSLISVQDHFGIRLGMECVPKGLEFASQLDVVVDLTVKNDPHCALGIPHRLVPGRRKVNDGEPTESKQQIVLWSYAFLDPRVTQQCSAIPA